MQYYDLHTTTRAEREALFNSQSFTWKEVSPHQVVAIEPNNLGLTLTNHRTKSLVWEEDTGEFRDMYFRFMYDVLDDFKAGKLGTYERLWREKTGETAAHTRQDRIYRVFENMRDKGFNPAAGDWNGVCVEATGERIDGSYRSAIACYLGIERIKVKEYAFDWRNVTKEFLQRKLKADWLQNGLDYYAIDFGDGLKNYEGKAGGNYKQNVKKWEKLKEILGDLKGKNIADLGCNAGYHSIQMAREGATVKAIDLTLTGSANLYKLVYSWLDRRDLSISFENDDIRTITGMYDTIVCLNTHYHLPEDRQDRFIQRLRTLTGRLVLQGNNNKKGEYKNVTADEMVDMCKRNGWHKVKTVEWEDKPFVIATM